MNTAQKQILSILSICYLMTFSLLLYTPPEPKKEFSSIDYILKTKISCGINDQKDKEYNEVAAMMTKQLKNIFVTKTGRQCQSLVQIRTKLLKKMGLKYLPKIKINKQVKIAVIDTGLNIKIPEFHKRLYLPDELILDSKGYGLDFSNEFVSYQPEDFHGHGSHVTGIILSIFPEAKILPIKYYNPKATGEKNLAALNKGLKAAIDAGVDIINISGGGPLPDLTERALMLEAQNKGIIVVLAAGNERSDVDTLQNHYYPASYGLDNMISVMNMEDYDNIAPSSNFGNWSVHLGTIGTNILSYGNGTSRDCTEIMTGTSQSTPIVTATVAMVMAEFPHLTYKEIKDRILNNTQKISILDGKNSTSGLLDIERSLANVKKEQQTH